MATIDDIFNTAVSIALADQAQAYNAAEDARNLGRKTLPDAISDYGINHGDMVKLPNSEHGTTIPDTVDPTQFYNKFTDVYNQLYQVAVNAIAGYLTKYFPTYIIDDELQAIIASKGDVFRSVEDSFWNKDAARINTEFQQRQDQTISLQASRGFPLPPGAMAAQLQELEIQRAYKYAEVSHQAAVKHIDVASGLYKFALEEANKARLAAINAAIEYMKALMMPADIASRFVMQTGNYQAQLIEAVASYYKAGLSRDELIMQASSKSKELHVNYNKINADLNSTEYDTQVKATVGAAQTAASVAQGALSALNAVGSIISSA